MQKPDTEVAGMEVNDDVRRKRGGGKDRREEWK